MAGVAYDYAPTIPAGDVDYIAFQRALGKLHEHTPLSYFRFDQQAPTDYLYKFKSADLRIWSQTLRYDGSPEQPLIETHGDFWTLTEINLHRDVRVPLLNLVTRFSLTSLHATFS
jgi:hypothetical protein